MENLLKKVDKIALFFIIYTVIFILFFKTLTYTLPFTLAFVFSSLLARPTRILIKKLKFKKSLAALVTTVVFFISIVGLLLWGIFHLSGEASQLAKNLQAYVSKQPDLLSNFYQEIYGFYNNLDPSVISTIEKNFSSTLTKVSNATLSITSVLVGGVISFFSSIPYVVMVIFFTLISTYYFTKDMTDAKDKVLKIIPSKDNHKIYEAFHESKKMLVNYFFSYLIVVSITFLITLAGFMGLGVRYALLLSFLSAIFDMLPIVGMAMIYIPVALVFLLSKNYFGAIAILVLYVFAMVVRQIVEPKIVSTSLGVHPVAIIAALFIGLMANGLLGIIYCVFLVVFYNVLNKTGVL